jgi:hypothetical protein
MNKKTYLIKFTISQQNAQLNFFLSQKKFRKKLLSTVSLVYILRNCTVYIVVISGKRASLPCNSLEVETGSLTIKKNHAGSGSENP